MRALAAALALGPLALATGCSSGSNTTPSPLVTTAPTAVPTTSAASLPADDWYTFAHDYERTGLETKNTSLTPATVSKLALRWKVNVGADLYDSPLVYGGNVIVATLLDGTVYDFAAATGKLIWKRTIGGELRATPSIDGGLVFVGNRLANGDTPKPSQLFALRLLDGSIAWEAPLNGVTHGSPVVAGGKVFIGTSGGDPPQCLNGGVTALDETTGSQLWRWAVNPPVGGGGSVWGAVSYNGTYLVFGTGNTCQNPIMTANGAAALTTDGNLAWSFVAHKDSVVDDDSGGGVLFSQGKASFINKNGSFYSLDPSSGQMLMNVPLGAADGQGGFTTPTSDGSTTLVGAGFLANAATAASSVRSTNVAQPQDYSFATARRSPDLAVFGDHSRLEALNSSGTPIWSKQMTSSLDGYAGAIANGIAYVELDDTLQALNLQSGASLWSFTAANTFEASPVVVMSGVYAADDSGNVYAFSIPAVAAAAKRY